MVAEARFLADGIAIVDGFASAGSIRALTTCAEVRRKRGEFSAARVGADLGLQVRKSIRGDRTCWLQEPLFAAERALLEDLEQLRMTLNRHGFLGLFDLELHHAHYPPGAGYVRHVDQLNGNSQRKVSVVLYLNDAWDAATGGHLRVFDATGGHRDIEPFAGRLVYFLSAGLEHAVLPTAVDRRSISGWFRSR